MELSEWTRSYGNILTIFNPHYNTLKWIVLLSPLMMKKTRFSEAGPLCVETSPERGVVQGMRLQSPRPQGLCILASPSHSAAQLWVNTRGCHGCICSQWAGLSPCPGDPHIPAVTRGRCGGCIMAPALSFFLTLI